MAVAELEKRGYHIIPESVKYKGDRMTLAYLEGNFGGFAVHLVQK
jgi:2-dehydro-3-deoxyphosphogluconate aldolase/(4S)-4-hydroxy-2-oxoglutarate aldolase